LLTFVGGIDLHYMGQRPLAWIGAGFGRGVDAKVAPDDDAEQYRWSPLDSVWRHVALVYKADRSIATLYIDGEIDKTYLVLLTGIPGSIEVTRSNELINRLVVSRPQLIR
jgi:hypothetical protein